MNAIETNKLTKRYGKARGITELDLAVKEGEFFGFIGPNGAGKSTTIRTLLGLIKPTCGDAKILGNSIEKPISYLNEIGYMPSEAMFYDSMKVKDLIKFSAKMRKKDCKEEAKRLCERFQLDTNKKIEALSLGNRKKVAIVCAMQHDPQLYIFDEPTSGLDPLMQKEFFEVLQEKNKKGATIFFSSHVLSEVQHNCSRAAIVKDGKLVVVDSIENLSKTNAKRVTLRGVQELPESFQAQKVERIEDSLTFLYHGDVKRLVQEIAVLPVTDVTIAEPELEEIFYHYYEGK
ncbi:MAG: ABC transporter ATP-binding protein [Lachnospiraceae bacterium]